MDLESDVVTGIEVGQVRLQPRIKRLPAHDALAFMATQIAKLEKPRYREWKILYRTDSPNIGALYDAYDNRGELRLNFADGVHVAVRIIEHSYGPHAGAGNTEFHFQEILPEDRPAG